jgi:hypothetical protein
VLSYAGVPLLSPTQETLAWARANLDVSWCHPAAARAGWGPAQAGLPSRGPDARGPLRPQVLRWPTGATRFSEGHFLVSEPQLDAVRAAVMTTSGAGPAAAPLTFSDGTRTVTAAQLFLLPPRPLGKVPGAPGLWLLSLVDDRYFWWLAAADVVVTAGSTTWDALYGAIMIALGMTLLSDPVDAAYLTPDASLTSHYEAVPPLLDAVCASVGQRLVANLDGTYHAQNAASARTALGTNLALLPRTAGGEMALAP